MSPKNHQQAQKLRDDVLKELHYRAYKILLRPELFQTPEAFRAYWKQARKIAKDLGLKTEKPVKDLPRRVRVVTFYDTPDFRLYQSGFILRQRRYVKDGFPVESMEYTLKFRHPDLELATGIDMTPTVTNHARIKFKEAILPDSKEQGAMRRVFSQNVVYKVERTDPVTSIGELQGYVPAISELELDADTPLVLVNNFRIGEVSVDLGKISFNDYEADADMSVWRNLGTAEILTAEFAWQSRFPEDFPGPMRASERAVAESFYKRLLVETSDWLLKGSTKTRIVYECGGRDVNCHE